jgi:antitoxin VapB
MPTTRAFKSGNSQAIRIPADMAYADMSQDLTITRLGDVITIYPGRQGPAEAVAQLRAMQKLPDLKDFERIEPRDIDWG